MIAGGHMGRDICFIKKQEDVLCIYPLEWFYA